MKQLYPMYQPQHDDPVADAVMLLGGYTLRAFRRRLIIAGSCFLLTIALTLAFLAVSSKTYRAESRLLVNTAALPATSPFAHRPTGMPGEPDPVAAIAEVIKSRDSLTWLVRDLGLVDRWQRTRTPLGRVADRVRQGLFGPLTPASLEDALAHIVERHVTVTGDGAVVSIAVDWHEREGALLIARALTQRFLDMTRERESNQLKNNIAALEKSLGAADVDVERAIQRLEAAAERANLSSGRNIKLRRPGEQPDLETVARLEQDLARKRETLARVEATYEARVSAAQQALNALRATLGPDHPDVKNAERNLALQSEIPENLAGLRLEESQLSSQLTRIMPSAGAAGLIQALATVAIVDPELELARDNYRRAADIRAAIGEHLRATRSELETTEEAFPDRFITTQPPLMPREAASPKPMPVLVGGLVAALFLAFVIAVLADVMTRRIQEPWQIARFVGVPVIGYVERH